MKIKVEMLEVLVFHSQLQEVIRYCSPDIILLIEIKVLSGKAQK